MKLQFDANQQFQLDAIAAMTSLFDGQPQGAPEYAVINVGEYGEMFSGQERTELGAGNRLLLAEEKLLANTRAVQIRNDIEVTQPDAPLEAWELFDAAAEAIHAALRGQRLIDADGRIQPAFKPQRPDFKLELPEAHADIAAAVVDLLAGYQIERHIRKERDERKNPLKKEVILSPEFQALWERIKPRTTYRVEFETDTLVRHAVEAIGRMAKVEAPRIRVSAGQVRVGKAGVGATAVSVAEERPVYGSLALPDILAYLQNETELTRSTLARILKESARLSEFFENPQRFLDQVVAILKNELHRLLVDGIKYERLPIGGPNTE
jgi:restriction endonuclease